MYYDICEMSIGDCDEVIALWRATEGVGLSESDTREAVALYLVRNPAFSFVARIDNKIVGAVLCGHDVSTIWLFSMTTDTEVSAARSSTRLSRN